MTKTTKTKRRADGISKAPVPLMDATGASITLADALARQESVRQELVALFKPAGIRVPAVESLTQLPRGTYYWSGLLLIYSSLTTKESLVVTRQHVGRRMHDVLALQLYCVPTRDQQLDIWARIMCSIRDALKRDVQELNRRLKYTNVAQMMRDRQAAWDAATKRIAVATKNEGPNARKLLALGLKANAINDPYSALLKLKQTAARQAKSEAMSKKKAQAAQLAQDAQA